MTISNFDAAVGRPVASRATQFFSFLVTLMLLCAAAACSNESTTNFQSSGVDKTSASVNDTMNTATNQLTSKPPTSSRPKIIAFGDSLTAGYGLAQTESYPYLLQQKLDADGYSYEVINAGVSGDTSAQGLARLEWALSDKPDVKIMILELGANDILRGQSISAMRANLARIIEAAQRRNIQVLLAGMFAPTNQGGMYQRQVATAYQSLIDEYEVPFIPFFLDRVAGRPELNLPDGVHPNANGTRLVADTVYQSLKPLLDEDATLR
ncbi:MAG: arylesterase [Pyrinomonadaceae bacterium MAG19_C2-C3]|nr:arylesterase [Pyrinomonadaceae bacterium MAG19_C2-C3]